MPNHPLPLVSVSSRLIPCLTADDVTAALHDLVKVCGSRVKASEYLGINRFMLASVLNGRALPGPKTLNKLGLKRLTVYVPQE